MVEFQGKSINDVNPFQVEDEMNAVIDGEVEIRAGKRGGSVNKLTVRVDAVDVSRLCALTVLCGSPVVISTLQPPAPLLQRGLIRCSLLDTLTPEDILERLKPQGVVAVRKLVSALDPKRSPGYVLSFDGEVPGMLKVCGMRLPVGPYSPPPMRCYGCQRYGHVKANCVRSRVCPRCALAHDGTHDEAVCSSPPRCAACRGPHDSRSTFCPQYRREANAKRYAREHDVSVSEAKVVLSQSSSQPPPRRVSKNVQENLSYASVTGSGSSQQSGDAFSQIPPTQSQCGSCSSLEARLTALESVVNTVATLAQTVAGLSSSMSSLTHTLNILVAKVDSLASAVDDSEKGPTKVKKRRQVSQTRSGRGRAQQKQDAYDSEGSSHCKNS